MEYICGLNDTNVSEKKPDYVTLNLDMLESSLGLNVNGNLEFVLA